MRDDANLEPASHSTPLREWGKISTEARDEERFLEGPRTRRFDRREECRGQWLQVRPASVAHLQQTCTRPVVPARRIACLAVASSWIWQVGAGISRDSS